MHHSRNRTLVAAAAALVTSFGAIVVGAPAANAAVDRDCGDFGSQRAAQIFFLNHGGPQSDPHGLDSEGDGIACESNPAPYYYRRSLPDSKPQPQPVTVRSSVDLSLSRSRAIAGEPVKLTAVAKPRGVRTVVFQRKDGRQWRTLDRDQTDRRGKDSLSVRAPRSGTDYRVVLVKKEVGRKTFTADTSEVRDLTVQKQTVRLDLSDREVGQEAAVRAVIKVSPVRRGRRVSLQVEGLSGWETVRRGEQDHRGREVFMVRTKQDLRDYRYRAVVHRANGAAAADSRAKTVTVTDQMDPATPTGLSAQGVDLGADLTWTAVVDQDSLRYTVRYRTSPDGAWVRTTDTWDTQMTLTGLVNGTPCDVQVSSLDPSGNRSAWSAATQVTPTAPPVEG